VGFGLCCLVGFGFEGSLGCVGLWVLLVILIRFSFAR
jgi:hypothetical protein